VENKERKQRCFLKKRRAESPGGAPQTLDKA
jgi:hypothetical protein